MSHKRKTRSISTLPAFNILNGKKNFDDNFNSIDHYLGEDVSDLTSPSQSFLIKENENLPKTPIHSYSMSGSELEGIYDLSTRLSGISSNSSVSWSDDYEVEISKKVQIELEKLHRALQGIEEVPPPHNKDEVKEWKKFFPHLSLLGQKTPTNSEGSSESDDELTQRSNSHLSKAYFPLNKNALGCIKQMELSQNCKHTNKNYNTLPCKSKNFEIDKYLKISSIKSSDTTRRKNNLHSVPAREESKEGFGDISMEYTSLPYITATSVKTQTRKPAKRPPKYLTLPPITNNFRSISATPRQTSSKSMFVSLNLEKDLSATDSQRQLKNDLMKLFDYIPISNR